MSLKYRIKALFNPNMYHGWHKTRRYFEGWYFKLVSKSEEEAIALIPGIAMNEEGEKHAFIQVLDGKRREAEYLTFPYKAFKASTEKFEVQIGNNYFSNSSIKLDHEILFGEIKLNNIVPWPSSLISPGIMGPFSFIPFMECYHGILSLNHDLKGEINFKGKEINFTNGKGYGEKDWGHSFPSAYIWMQSNHFTKNKVSVKASVAKIPWLGTSFVGFIAGVLIDDVLVQFTTYNFSKLKKCYADEKSVSLIIENRNYKLVINAIRSSSTELASPIGGFMDGRINESMTDLINVELYDKKKKVFVLKDIGRNSGLEVAGKIKEILV